MPAVSGTMEYIQTSVATTAELSGVTSAALNTGDLAYVVTVASGSNYFILDHASVLAVSAGIIATKESLLGAVPATTPGRWIQSNLLPLGAPAPAPVPGTGGLLAYGEIYALQGVNNDNPAPIAPGAPVLFPRDGTTRGSVARDGASTSALNLPLVGDYLIQWQVSVTEADQLELFQDIGGGFVQIADSVVGRTTGTSQIIGQKIITTTAPNTKLEVRNPAGNATNVTVTTVAGGTHDVSATFSAILLNTP